MAKLVSRVPRMATAGSGRGTTTVGVSVVGRAATSGDSVGARVATAEGSAEGGTTIDGIWVITGVAIAGGSIAGLTTSAGVAVGASRSVTTRISATGPVIEGIA